MSEPADRVRDERLARKWSAREAARRGGISNTAWSDFENRRTGVTERIDQAVQQAFGWPTDWAAEGSPLDALKTDLTDALDRLTAIEARLEALEAAAGTDDQFAMAGYGGQIEDEPIETVNRPSPPAEDGDHIDE